MILLVLNLLIIRYYKDIPNQSSAQIHHFWKYQDGGTHKRLDELKSSCFYTFSHQSHLVVQYLH